jgi:hypothetical protein
MKYRADSTGVSTSSQPLQSIDQPDTPAIDEPLAPLSGPNREQRQPPRPLSLPGTCEGSLEGNQPSA